LSGDRPENHPRSDRYVGCLVDQTEPTGRAIAAMFVEAGPVVLRSERGEILYKRNIGVLPTIGP
jgi:hypothetical protein